LNVTSTEVGNRTLLSVKVAPPVCTGRPFISHWSTVYPELDVAENPVLAPRLTVCGALGLMVPLLPALGVTVALTTLMLKSCDAPLVLPPTV
jgi:hypothetical protein